ncbi:MAG TPA: hypothetical protein VEL74_03445 [Thermoanaerobaculia bacterium]|nr:hypothetical protein [Thermoanaerobaculia bacterium]
MKLRLMLVLAVVTLTLGLSAPAPADPPITPQQCAEICETVRCAAPTTCGLYVGAKGQVLCGCH